MEPEEAFPRIDLVAFPSEPGGCLPDQESLGGRKARRSRQVRRLWGRDPSRVAAAPGGFLDALASLDFTLVSKRWVSKS